MSACLEGLDVRVVWGVSRGDYSSYSVLCMFETQELAQAHADALNGEDRYGYNEARVEEFRLYDQAPEQVVWWSKFLRLNEDGSQPPTNLEPQEHAGFEYDRPFGLSKRPRVDVMYSEPYSGRLDGSSHSVVAGPGQYGVEIEGLDRDAVGKTVSEFVARWKANLFRLEGARPWR